MYLTILPTEKCNFRCKYCYEDFKIGKMKRPVIDGVKNLLSREFTNIDNLSISWFGGEPTTNLDAVLEISNHITDHANQREGFVYSGHMTTNGFLLDLSTFKKLMEVGVNKYQITLDGDPEAHDYTRVQANGKGSFAEIWSNLMSFKTLSEYFEVDLRIHITSQNKKSVARLGEMLRDEFFEDDRYRVNFETIKDLGQGVETSNPHQHIPKDDGNDRVEQLIADFSGKLSNTLQDVKNGNPYICYASMPRQLLIRADGRIGKCTVMLNDERNNVGRINEDGSLDIHDKKFDTWTRGFNSLDSDELRCPAMKLPKFELA